jgi:hypothetical protein
MFEGLLNVHGLQMDVSWINSCGVCLIKTTDEQIQTPQRESKSIAKSQ